MGGKQSIVDEEYTQLTEEEIHHMYDLFNQVCQTGPANGCTYYDFLRFCENVHPLLIEFLVKFYFGDNPEDNIKSVKEFVSFYVYLVRGSIEDRIKVMEIMLLDKKHDPSSSFQSAGHSKFHLSHVSYDTDEHTFSERLDNYLQGLLCSYIQLEYHHPSQEFLSWRDVKSSFTPTDVESLAATLKMSFSRPITPKDFEVWVTGWKTIQNLHYAVYSNLFRLENTNDEGIKSLFPLCVMRYKLTETILDMCSVVHLNSYLPPKCRHRWKLLFSTVVQDLRYQHLLRRILYEGPSIVVIKDKHNYIFGGFASESWHPFSHSYGGCSSFLFRIKPNLEVYEASGQDENYQYIQVKKNPRGFGMGKGTKTTFGWWIEPDHLRGTCSRVCSTFQKVPILASAQDFRIQHFEVWGVDDSRKRRERRDSFIKCRKLTSLKHEHDSNLSQAGRSLLLHAEIREYSDGCGSSYEDQKQRIIQAGKDIYTAGNLEKVSEEDEEETVYKDEEGG